MRLYIKYISLLLKSQLQYKASFIMTVITQFIQPFALLAGIYLLFERFGSIKGWTLYEVFMCYAVIGACLAVSTCFARGFDSFDKMIRTATFDRVLVRPRGTMLQILGSNFDIKRIGHFLQSLTVLAIAILGADIAWDITKVIMLFNMLIGGSVIFSGIYMLQAAAAFWTIEALEVASIFTHGMKEHASYPLNIFPKWITVIFTFIIPFGTVNYLPLQYLLGKTGGNGWFYAFLPLLGALFILPCILAWKLGVRKYSSAGS
ncbi:membrane protein [Clostridia bacterium]|nr:membrane protein [Clostridia bacterium]